MAALFKASLGNNFNNVSGTTLAITTTAAIAVGDFVVVRWAADNLSATTPTATCSDGNNTYTVQSQGAVNATAAAGVAGGIITTLATVAKASGSTITLTFSGAITGKAAYAESFTGVTSSLRFAAISATGASTAPSPGTTSSVPIGDLVLGVVAAETRAAITADPDATGGSWSAGTTRTGGGTSGQDATSVTASGQYKITTAAGAQTFNQVITSTEWWSACVVMQAAPDPAVIQAAYQYFDDAGTEAGAASLAAVNTAITANTGNGDQAGVLRVRMQVGANPGFSTDDWQLQWEKNGNGTWTNVTTGGNTVLGYNNPNLTDAAVTTNRLGAGSGSFVAGKISETGLVSDLAITASNYTELVFSVKLLAANFTDGDTLRFRVLYNGATTAMTYTVVPTINVVRVVTQIIATRATTWNVLTPVTATRATTWNVAAAPAGGGGTPPTIVATTLTDSGSNQNVVNVPAGGQAGDYYVVWYTESDNSTPPPARAISGFTTESVMQGISGCHQQWFWKAYSGTEGTTFAVTGGGSSWCGTGCILVRGLPAGWTPTIAAPSSSPTNSTITVASAAASANTLMLSGYKNYHGGSPVTYPAGWVKERTQDAHTLWSQPFTTAGTSGGTVEAVGGAGGPALLSRMFATATTTPSAVTNRGESTTGVLTGASITLNHPAFTPAAGSLVVLMPTVQMFNNTGSSQTAALQPSDTFGDIGGGAWVKAATSNRGLTNDAAWPESVDIWTRKIGTTPGSGVITTKANYTGGAGAAFFGNGYIWQSVVEVAPDHAGAVGAVASPGAQVGVASFDCTLNAAAASDSIGFTCFQHDYNATAKIYTAPTGFTVTDDDYDPSWGAILAAAYKVGSVPTTISWTGLTASERVLACAAEIKMPVAAALYSDDFNRANGALGSPWVTVDAALAISGNKLSYSTNGSVQSACYDMPLASDQWAEASLTVLAGTYNSLGPMIRMGTAGLSDAYYLWYDSLAGPPAFQVWKRVGGSYSQVGTNIATPAGTYKMRLEAQGTTIRVFKDGTQVLSTPDTSIASGKAGFLGDHDPTQAATADNFRCGDLPYVPLVYSDDFNRANGALTTPWVTIDGSHSIVSGKVAVGPASPNDSYYDAAFSADQWAEADVDNEQDNQGVIFPVVRMGSSAGGDLYYYWIGSPGTRQFQINKRQGGSYSTVVSSGGPMPTGPFKARLEIQGATLRAYADGVLVATGTDSSPITTGKPGILSANGTGGTLDNFRAGDLPYVPAGGGTTTVTATRSTTWNTRFAVAATTRSTTWVTKTLITATRATTWNVTGSLTFVGASRSTTWATKASVAATRATTWNVLVTAPSGGVFFSDDFQRADGPPGSNYNVTDGSMLIESGVLRGNTSEWGYAQLVGTPPSNDQYVQITAVNLNRQGGCDYYLRSSGTAANNTTGYSLWWWLEGTNGPLHVGSVEIVGGTASGGGEYIVTAPAPGGTFTARMEVVGTTWTLYYNGAQLGTGAFVTSPSAPGKFALDSYDGGRLDYVEFGTPGAPTTKVTTSRATTWSIEPLFWKGTGVITDWHPNLAADLATVKAGWWYDWTNYQIGTGRTDPVYHAPNSAYVPMIWGDWISDPRLGPPPDGWDLGAGPYAGEKIILGFNEPDDGNQANMSVSRALELWPQLEATGARLGSPAGTGGSTAWLASFMSGNGGGYIPRVDFICAHYYPGYNGSVTDMATYLDYLHATYGKPIWLTEVSNLSGDVANNTALISQVMDVCLARPWIERVGWFILGPYPQFPGTKLVESNGALTTTGAVYDDYSERIIRAGTTTVTATRSTTWATKAAVTSTRATTWRVLSPVTATKATTWNTRFAVAGTKVTTWNTVASVAATRGTTWVTRFAVAATTRATTWRTLAPITMSAATTWNTLVPGPTVQRSTLWHTKTTVFIMRAATWNTLVPVATPATRSTTWSVLTPVTATRATTWSVIQGVVASRATTWNTAGSLTTVSASRSTTWAVAATVGASRGSTWAVLAKVTPTSRSTTWNALAAVASASTRSTTWAVLTPVAPTTRSTTWVVLARLTGTRQTTWQALAVVAPVTRPTLWNAQGQVSTTRQTSWNVGGALAFVSASRSTTWTTRATITPTRSTTWDVLTRVFPAITRSTTWSVLTPVTPTTRSTTWFVRVQVTLSRPTSWNTAGSLYFIGASRSTAWVVRTTTSTSRATTWRALAQIPVMRAATWSVRTPTTSQRSTTWRTRESVVTARVTTWRVSSRTLALRSTTWRVAPAATILHYLTLYPNTILYRGPHRVTSIYQGSTKVWP